MDTGPSALIVGLGIAGVSAAIGLLVSGGITDCVGEGCAAMFALQQKIALCCRQYRVSPPVAASMNGRAEPVSER